MPIGPNLFPKGYFCPLLVARGNKVQAEVVLLIQTEIAVTDEVEGVNLPARLLRCRAGEGCDRLGANVA